MTTEQNQKSDPPVILASASQARARMLEAAGVSLESMVARVDEASVKEAMLAENAPPRNIADRLAELKAIKISAKHPEALVIGADQVLVCEGKLYDKPDTHDAARLQLSELKGKTHELLSACVICEGARPVWRHIGRAQLTARDFSDGFLNTYIEQAGDALLSSVGAYQLESVGAQLFSQVKGDYFTVLGLPLLEVLGYLRARGVLIE